MNQYKNPKNQSGIELSKPFSMFSTVTTVSKETIVSTVS